MKMKFTNNDRQLSEGGVRNKGTIYLQRKRAKNDNMIFVQRYSTCRFLVNTKAQKYHFVLKMKVRFVDLRLSLLHVKIIKKVKTRLIVQC